MSKLLLGSDFHFGHRFMAKLRAERQFFPYWDDIQACLDDGDERAAIKMMDTIMIMEWNRIAGRNDEVYVIGDLSFYDFKTTKEIFDRLNGRKHLLKGNHDPKWITKLGWVTVNDFKRVRWDDHSFYLMHYPMLTWPNAHKGTFHLHGHTHGNLRAPESTRMDVGVDCTGKVLIGIEECYQILSAKKYDYIDHHNPEKYQT